MYPSMKTSSKTIPALTICLSFTQISLLLLSGILLQSCIMTTIVQEIEETVTQQELYTTKGETHKEGLLTLQIENNAENIMLLIDSLEICNIQLIDPTGEITYNNDLTIINSTTTLFYGTNISFSESIVPAQKLTPWNPAELPSLSNNSYAKIYGTLHSYLPNNETYPIYTGIMYYPISGTISASKSGITISSPTPLAITIHPYCPLYTMLNGKIEKILQPITFTATVDDWE